MENEKNAKFKTQNIQNDQPSVGNNSRPPTPPFQNCGQNHNNQQTPTPPHQNQNRHNPLPPNLNNRNVNPNRGVNQNRGNPANEDQFLNLDDLRNVIPDDEPFSVPGYQSPEHVSIHSEYSDDAGNYDERVEDDIWGDVNAKNLYNARGFENEDFGYQNANYVGNNEGYGYGRNDRYDNNRQSRNNNQRNQDDGYYNNNNNVNRKRIPQFVGGGNQGGDRGGYRRGNRRPGD
ncbi:GATA zinc finger domain-containing protein 14-like [Helianthus annuus]|uniref:GATA zinc finger domain-containing protein 14-like n=1 Tax=Helianthus annuus TaxID=4232 RepID=UPI000B8FF8E7|nr:GATA zinc finger domain-containing protein 14-like [Helianthus annuus]